MQLRRHRIIAISLVVVVAILLILVLNFSVGNKPTVTMGFPDTIQRVLPSVVHIMCDRWQGSGVALTEDIIVTARHVVDGVDYIITLNDGTTVKGIQAITHKDYDIGFIKVDAPNLVPAKFGSVIDCVLGQPLFAIGSTTGKINFNSVSLGIVSGLNRSWTRKTFDGKDYGWTILFQTDAEGMGGNSGCPVFSMDGLVRGVWVGSMLPAVHYSIPSDVFMNDIEIIKLLFAFEKYSVKKRCL